VLSSWGIDVFSFRGRSLAKQVEFVSLPLADHYFGRQADRLALLSAMEAFLAKHNPAD
jgi:hypothetical protein